MVSGTAGRPGWGQLWWARGGDCGCGGSGEVQETELMEPREEEVARDTVASGCTGSLRNAVTLKK